jgi:hypothetical protein
MPPAFKNRLVVVDANVFLSDVGYAAEHARKTTLLGEAEMGFVRVLTTPQVLCEVERNLDTYARNTHVSPEDIRSLWAKYRQHLSVFDPPPVSTQRSELVKQRDPEDLPMAHVIEVLQPSLALSRDKDLIEAGLISPGDWLDMLTELNDASSYEAAYVAADLGGAFLIVGVGSFLVSASLKVRDLLRRIPRDVWLGLASLVGVTLLYPVTRSKIVAWVRKAADRWQVHRPAFVQALADLDKVLSEISASYADHQENVTNAQPVKGEPGNLYHDVLRTLAQAPFPLTAAEVSDRLRQSHPAESPNQNRTYEDILAVLGKAPDFARDDQGRWYVKGIRYQCPGL